MIDLLALVTPLTAGLIWLVPSTPEPGHGHYAQVDYLTNGLLTSSLNAGAIDSSRLIVTNNFGRSLYVFIVLKPVSSEIRSFADLIERGLKADSDLVLVDEAKLTDEILRMVPAGLHARMKSI